MVVGIARQRVRPSPVADRAGHGAGVGFVAGIVRVTWRDRSALGRSGFGYCRWMASFADRRPVVGAVAGVAGLAAGAVLVLLLAVIPPSDEISVLRQTISQYGLSDNAWLFDIAVLLVVAGSAVILGSLRRRGGLPGVAAVFGAGWVLGLLLIVAVPKANWALVTGFSVGGTLHRAASLIAFSCLPLAVLTAARTAFADSPGRRFAVRLFAVLSLCWFGVLLGAICFAAATGERWWEVVPLGLVERGLALTELVSLALLARAGAPTREPLPV